MAEEIKPENIFSAEFAISLGALLPRGGAMKIATQLKCSRAAVSLVFKGTYCNYHSPMAKAIIRKAVEITKKSEQQDVKDSNSLMSLIKK